MKMKVGVIAGSVLATAFLASATSTNASADAYGWNWNGYRNLGWNGYNNWGWNGYRNLGWNGYNNWGWNGYNNWNNYGNWNGYHNWNWNYNNWGWNDYNNWNNNGYNSLRNDPRYRYSNGYHYYVLDDGSYYYYKNGQWIYVKNSNPTTPGNDGNTDTPSNPTTPGNDGNTDTPSNPTTPGNDGNTDTPSNPGITLPDKPAYPEPGDNETPKPSNPTNPSDDGTTPNTPPTPGLVTTDEPSESQIPPYTDKPSEGLEHLDWAPDPNIDYSKLPKPLYRPDDPRMQKDPRFVNDNGTYYYRVHLGEENPKGIDGYYKWMGHNWKLFNGTDPNDPALDPKLHEKTDDDEYMYSDTNSSVKLYSTNLVATGKAGQPLPFQNVEEFKNYVIKQMNPVFKDNSGWDAKVEWKIDDEDLFNQSKQNPWAKDYVITANLTSSVKGYEKTEFGYVKFVYRVEATDDTNYIELDKAKAAFNEINKERKAQGLKELTWSDEIYNSQALPKVHSNSRQYDSTGIVGRRDEDPAVVANKWLKSGLRELLLDPNATEGAVAAVINGEGTYYWAFNYK